MKKTLLSLALAAFAVFGASAETVGFGVGSAGETGTDAFAELKNNASGNVVDEPFTAGDITIQLTKFNNSSSNVNGTALRWYQNDEITITPANGVKITGIEINAVNSYAKGITVSYDGAANTTMSVSGTTETWSDADGVESPITLKAAAQVRFTYMHITYVAGEVDPDALAAPVIECAKENGTYYVTMSTTEEGATIYYTENGENPSIDDLAVATEYTGKIEVWESATYKAITVKDGKASAVTTYTSKVPMQLDDFSAIYGIEPAEIPAEGYDIEVNADMTVVYQSADKAYLYLYCNNYYALFYGGNTVCEPGSKITTVSGNLKNYCGLVEITNYTLGEATPGTLTVQPIPMETVEGIGANMQNHYLKLMNVTISDINGSNATVTDSEGNTLTIRNNFKLDNFGEAENVDIVGFVGAYGKTAEEVEAQFYPCEITTSAGTDVVAAPTFNPESGSSIALYSFVLLSSTQDDAVLYYSLDGENFSDYADDEIMATSVGEMTVYAYAEIGNEKSETVEATFTVTKANPNLRFVNYEGEEVAEVIYVLDGEDEQYFPELIRDNWNGEPTFESSNTTVATVSEYGEIVVLALGETTITATLAETSQYSEGTASYLLKVISKEQAAVVETVVDLTVVESFSASNNVQTWTSEDGYEFTVAAYVSVNNTYPANNKTDLGLHIYGTSNNVLAITAPENYNFIAVGITIGSMSLSKITIDGQTAYDPDATSAARAAAAGDEYSVELTEPKAEIELQASGAKNTSLTQIKFTMQPVTSGIESVEVSEAEDQAVYYNLQGVRIANPANGLYIRVAGKQATKVYVR